MSKRKTSEVTGKSNTAEEYTRRELFQMTVPRGLFPTRGLLVLDKVKCSACALCVQECPTGALIVDGTESITLIFHENLCDSCGLCLKVCPEQCLKLERGSEKAESFVFFKDEFARCKECGVVIGSQAMINRIHSKLGINDSTLARGLQLCPECKGKLRYQDARSRLSITNKDGGHG